MRAVTTCMLLPLATRWMALAPSIRTVRLATSPVSTMDIDTKPPWTEIEEFIPTPAPREAALTLYRDTNGWCPFCERVWLQLHAKGIPFDETLINLRDKPEWYKALVPTTLVPAIKMGDEVVWESAQIMQVLEERFPDTPLQPAEGTSARAEMDEFIAACPDLLKSGFRFASGMRNQSLSDEERQQRRAEFETALDLLNERALHAGGPFLHGSAFSLADAFYAPFLERWAAQWPLTIKFDVRQPERWPAIDAWFEAMEALPAYAQVKGDGYSWTAAVSAFTRMFSTGEVSDEAAALIRRADAAAAAAMRGGGNGNGGGGGGGGGGVRGGGGGGVVRGGDVDSPSVSAASAHLSPSPAILAASKLVRNREAVVADAVCTDPKSQKQLQRLEPDEAPLVDAMLAEAAKRLIIRAGATRSGRNGVSEEISGESSSGISDEMLGEGADASIFDETLLTLYTQPFEAAVYAKSARFVAARLCVPRDMSAAAAAEMRAVLIDIAAEAEAFAWRTSGGLL